MNYMCCWWRGTCSKSSGKALTKKKKRCYNAPVNLLGKTSGPGSWTPKIPIQILTRPYLSRYWFLDICRLEFFAHLIEYYMTL
jgi:hypothetical protein